MPEIIITPGAFVEGLAEREGNYQAGVDVWIDNVMRESEPTNQPLEKDAYHILRRENMWFCGRMRQLKIAYRRVMNRRKKS